MHTRFPTHWLALMKLLVTLLFLAMAAVTSVAAQTFSLFDIDASGFPTVRAKIHAFDAAGNEISPTPTDVAITENGVPRRIISITCPPPAPPRPLSSVLVVDVSKSME